MKAPYRLTLCALLSGVALFFFGCASMNDAAFTGTGSNDSTIELFDTGFDFGETCGGEAPCDDPVHEHESDDEVEPVNPSSSNFVSDSSFLTAT
ncbi:MAG: hypothetical protein ACL93V_13790 [Candidatus Electrothrix sp. YB6]